MKENGSDDYFRAFVASKYNQTLMKKMSLQAHTTLFSISSSTLGVATTTLFSISNTGGVGHGRQRDWHADPIMPQNLDQIAAAAPEDVKIASVRICAAAHILTYVSGANMWRQGARARNPTMNRALPPHNIQILSSSRKTASFGWKRAGCLPETPALCSPWRIISTSAAA